MTERWQRIVAGLVIIGLVVVVNFLFFYNLKIDNAGGDFVPTYRNVNNGGDQMVYFSLIRQSVEGKNILLNLYTNEPQLGLISPLWWLLGKITAVLNLSIPLAYYLFTMLSAAALLFFVYYLTRNLFAIYWQRLVALLLVTFGGGLGIFFVGRILFPAGGKALTEDNLFSQIISADLWYGEGFGFLSLRHSPLFILTQFSLLVLFWWLAEKISKTNWWQAWLIGVGVFILTIIHPYDVVPLAGFVLVYGLLFWREKSSWQNWLKVVPLGVGGLAAVLYFFYLRFADPSFLGWSAQNVTRTPYPLSFLAGYFWLLVPAVYGSVIAFRHGNKRLQWLAVWLVVAAFLIFLPTQTQRRFGSGVYIPIAMLAWYGWIYFWKNKNTILYLFSTIIYILFSTITFVLITCMNVNVIKTSNQLVKISAAEIQALDYYKRVSGESDVLLTSYSFGNLVPAYVSRKVYIGHGHQTINWPEKMMFLVWFYKNNGMEKQKYEQLLQRKISHVWMEKTGETNFLTSFFESEMFEKIYSNDKVIIYKVKE